jgi:cyanase
MRRRIASINDLLIAETDRKFHWPLGRRPDAHRGLSELGLWRLGKTLAWTEKDDRGANDEARRPDGKDSRHEAREGLELETHLRRDRRNGADVDRRRAARPDEAREAARPKAAELFALSDAEEAMLNEVPHRGTPMPPTDPLIYRFYELVMVNGPAWKALIEEEFGDGIMSAIDFSLDFEREPNPKGDRVKITMSGKFLPYKYYGAEQGIPEYGFKEAP